jgi:hypothetical protein
MKNEDYLWDKTGPPDAETEGLEQLFGAFRHQPGRPAWLEEFAAEEPTPVAPNVIPFAPRRRWWQPIVTAQAIAAAVALCFVAGGLWLGLTRNQPTERAGQVAGLTAPLIALPSPTVMEEVRVNTPVPSKRAEIVGPARVIQARATVRRVSAPPRLVAVRATTEEPEITPAEGRKAMADLALAMRVLNSTLNLAQRNAESNVIIIPAVAR